jgi:Cytochrome c7 and related cytochrome c/Class III cytochrome C family
MRRRIITLCIIAPFFAAVFVYPRWSSNALESSVAQQQQRRRRRQPARAPASRTPSRDYSKFSHASPTHRRQECSACHDAPTRNWRAASGFPDVSDYPDHASCIRCHRQQFFTGARPPLCTICHTRVSPASDARPVFPKRSTVSQFTVEFPHDKHQDVIASRRPSTQEVGEISFVPASLAVHSQSGDALRKKYNNCAICHETDETPPAAPPGGWRDGFVPASGSFKTVPRTHASCFNCHWKNQEPVADDCAGCHKPALGPRAEAPHFRRISVKFTHTREQHTAECTTCHINITRAGTLRGLQPDVPVNACAGCHKTSTDRTVATIETELERRKKDAGFTCAKCHTSELGKKSVPPSHYGLFSD